LLGLFGLVFAFGLPPCQVPDESAHFLRSYHLSEGHLFLRMTTAAEVPEQKLAWGGGEVPDSVLRVMRAPALAALRSHPERKVRPADYQDLLRDPLAPGRRHTASFAAVSHYTFVPYLPQAAAIWLGRSLGLNALLLSYAGRLGNLCAAVLLLYLAIRTTPVFKLVFGALGLLPMSVQQAASLSADASTSGAAFVLVAVLLRLAVGPPRPVRPRELAGLYFLAAWVGLCKLPFAPLALLYLAVPPGRLGSRHRYLLAGAGLLLVSFGAAALTSRAAHAGVPPSYTLRAGYHVSPGEQTEVIRAAPLRFARVCLRNCVENGPTWVTMLWSLGCLDAPLPPLAANGFLIFLVILGLADRTPGIAVPVRVKAAAILAAGACLVLILTALYLGWTAVGAEIIEGIQGRYFIPLLPLLLLPLYNQAVAIRADGRLLFALAVGACAGVQFVAVMTFVGRYYVAGYRPLSSSPAWLAAAALLAALVVLVVRRRLGPRERPERRGERPLDLRPGSG
jgi:hypothetical protein